MAEAEAKAHHILELNRAETEIAVAELQRRAAARIINEEMTKQENIESITAKAAQQVNDDARPEDIEDDWITNFFDKCRIVSDEDMQQLWAHILAGESNHPGSFSRRTVNLVADLDKRDAALFQSLCQFVWILGSGFRPLIFDTDDEIYPRNGITFATLVQLETLGLINFDPLAGFAVIATSKQMTASYCGKSVILALPEGKDKDYRLSQGRVILTQAGRELLGICRVPGVDGFFDYVYDKWAEQSLVPPRAG